MVRPVPFSPRSVIALAALSLLMILVGCEDTSNFAITSIEGSVTDPTGFGLPGVRLGVLYQVVNQSAPGPPPLGEAAMDPPGTAAQAITLGNPYPNPVAAPPNSVRLPFSADRDTTVRLEIWTQIGGISTLVTSLYSGAVSAGANEAVWDGYAEYFQGGPVPNGMYTVRLTVPAVGEPNTRSEASLLINRTLLDMKNLDPFTEGVGFNGLSGGDGSFLLSDIAAGQTFTLTNASSQAPLGTGITRNLVTLAFSDPDFQDALREVPIGAGDVVTLGPQVLVPLAAAPSP